MVAFETAAIVGTALVGGVVPLFVRWSDRQLHGALALSTGIFLGAVFLHLLPSLTASLPALQEVAPPPVTATLDPDALQPGYHGRGSTREALVWMAVLVGVLGIYLLENLVLRPHEHDDVHHHRAVGYAALFSLSIHSFTTGVGFAAAAVQSSVSAPMLIAIASHKGFEAFSITTVFRLARFSRRRIVLLVILFSLITPLGIFLGKLVTKPLGPLGLSLVMGLAAGTFLFICLCELLPEVFHRREDSRLNLALLTGGIALMALFHGLGG